jgi:hypothetical protein
VQEYLKIVVAKCEVRFFLEGIPGSVQTFLYFHTFWQTLVVVWTVLHLPPGWWMHSSWLGVSR